MANKSKSADRLDPAPRASTQKDYAETSPEVAKRGNQTRRTEETDQSDAPSTFENTEYLKKTPSNATHRNEDEDEESDFDEEDDSEYDEEDDSDFDDEDDSDFDEDDEDDEDDESDFDEEEE